LDNNNVYIESAVILNINNLEDYKKVRFSKKDFSVFGEAFEFLSDYFQENQSFPPRALLYKKFPTKEDKDTGKIIYGLDPNAVDVSLDYSIEQFGQQVLFRKVMLSFKNNEKLLKENPFQAFPKIMDSLNNVNIDIQEDIEVFDSGSEDRYDEYGKRKELRNSGIKTFGIPTIFRSLNSTGTGYMPGESITFFARPKVGKTWIAVKSAVIASNAGYRTLFISAEMPLRQIKTRTEVIAGNSAGYKFSYNGIENGTLSREEETEYKRFLKEYDKKNMFACDHLREDTFNIGSVRNLISKYSPSFVVIDAIQLFGSGEKSVWEKMTSLFYGVKNICLSKNIVALVTTQANRNANDLFIPPTVSDVSFSDGALQSCDMLFSACLVDGTDERLVQFQTARSREAKFNKRETPNDVTYLKFNVNEGIIEEKPEEEF